MVGPPPKALRADPERVWDNHLCSCFTPFETCLLSWFCPCIVYGRTAYRLRTKHASLDNSYSTFNKDCGIFCALSAVTAHIGPMFLGIIQRDNLRNVSKQKGPKLAGGNIEDCCAYYCCFPCAVAQTDKEAVSLLSGGDYAQNIPLEVISEQPKPNQGMELNQTG